MNIGISEDEIYKELEENGTTPYVQFRLYEKIQRDLIKTQFRPGDLKLFGGEVVQIVEALASVLTTYLRDTLRDDAPIDEIFVSVEKELCKAVKNGLNGINTKCMVVTLEDT